MQHEFAGLVTRALFQPHGVDFLLQRRLQQRVALLMHHRFVAADLGLAVAELLIPLLRFLCLEVILLAIFQQDSLVHEFLEREGHVLA